MKPTELRVLLITMKFKLFIFMPFHIYIDLDIETVECNFMYHSSQLKKKYRDVGLICVHSGFGTKNGR
jgi:hypothetical protein